MGGSCHFSRSHQAGLLFKGIEEAHNTLRVRDCLRKFASVAITIYKKHFLKHNKYRVNEFLGKVECGEAMTAAGALFPHEIIKGLHDNEGDRGQVAEQQWRRMVEDLSAKGKLKNYIVVCDVSGSMEGTPMEVSVDLGLLLSELSEH